MPPVSRKDSSTVAQGLADRQHVLGQRAHVGDHRARVGDRGDAGLRRLAERLRERDRGLAERAEAADDVVDVRRLRVQVGQHRRRSRRPASRGCTIVGCELVEERGQRLDVGGEVVAALGGGLGHVARVADRARHARAVARQRRQDRVRVDRQLLEHRVLARRGSRAPCRSPASAGLARRMTSLRSRAAAGEAGAELVEDQRQALALGLAHRVADQVDVDRLRRCWRPAAGAGPCPGRP